MQEQDRGLVTSDLVQGHEVLHSEATVASSCPGEDGSENRILRIAAECFIN